MEDVGERSKTYAQVGISSPPLPKWNALLSRKT